MRAIRHCFFVLFVFSTLTACISRGGVAEFTVYKSVFDDSAAVTTSIIDQLAAAERIVEKTARFRPNRIGVDPVFVASDAAVYSDLTDPPLAAQYRRALATVNQYNKVMLGFATGQGFDTLQAEIFGFATQAGATADAIAGTTSIAGTLAPYLGILREISSLVVSARSRAVFREKFLEYHPDVIAILETMREGSEDMFPNLTFKLEADILDGLSRGQNVKTLQEKHYQTRVLLSDWVVLMNKNIDALNAVKLAIENPGLGTQLSGATAELIALQSTVNGVRKRLADLNTK